MKREHTFKLNIEWTGNKGIGTADYLSYGRNHRIWNELKPDISGSSDPAFRGDRSRYSPEELLVASISSCHMLWFLHLCADNGVIVTEYIDTPTGIMTENVSGGGKFKEVNLYPDIKITDSSMVEKINELHEKAGRLCFIANSVNFPIHHKCTCRLEVD